MSTIEQSGYVRRPIKNTKVREIIDYCIKKSVWAVVVLLCTLSAYHIGLGWLIDLTGEPKPNLSAIVTCEGWKAPYCVDKGIIGYEMASGLMYKLVNQIYQLQDALDPNLKNVAQFDYDNRSPNETVWSAIESYKDFFVCATKLLGGLLDDASDFLLYCQLISIVRPVDIEGINLARSLYTIKVVNTGDKETIPTATIPGNLYSEVTREVGKGDGRHPEEHFRPKEIVLGPIHPGRTVDVKAWVTSKPNRRNAKKLKITCADGVPASLNVETPVRTCVAMFNRHFYASSVVISLVLLFIVHLMRGRQRNDTRGAHITSANLLP